MKSHDLAVIGTALVLLTGAAVGLSWAPLATLLLIGLLLLCPLMMLGVRRGGHDHHERADRSGRRWWRR